MLGHGVTKADPLSVVTEAGAAAARSRNERDTWLGRAVDAVLSGHEQGVLIEAGRLMERLARFEPVRLVETTRGVS